MYIAERTPPGMRSLICAEDSPMLRVKIICHCEETPLGPTRQSHFKPGSEDHIAPAADFCGDSHGHPFRVPSE